MTVLVDVTEELILARLKDLGLGPKARGRIYHDRTVGLRCPAHPLGRQVLGAVTAPVLATSANRHGRRIFTFGVGEDDRRISMIDSDGVALAAIQGLHQLVQEKDALITSQQEQIDSLESRLTALEQGTVFSEAPQTISASTALPFISPPIAWALLGGLSFIGILAGYRLRRKLLTQ